MFRLFHACGLGILLVAGCGLGNSPSSGSASASGYFGDLPVLTTVECCGMGDKFVLLVWSDATTISRSEYSESPFSFTHHGEFSYEDGRKLAWVCNASKDGLGTLTIAGVKYDLADGYIFLVSQKDHSTKVQQLKREAISMLDVDREINDLGHEAEIIDFFEKKPESKDSD